MTDFIITIKNENKEFLDDLFSSIKNEFSEVEIKNENIEISGPKIAIKVIEFIENQKYVGKKGIIQFEILDKTTGEINYPKNENDIKNVINFIQNFYK